MNNKELFESMVSPLPILDMIWKIIEEYSWLTPISSDTFVNASFLATVIIPFVWFYLYGFWFYLIDRYTSEEFKYSHKVQNTIRITSSQYTDAFFVSLRNWFFIGFPYLFLVCKMNEWYLYHDGTSFPLIPSISVMVKDLTVYILIEEILFYFSHRALHSGRLYSLIHKFHHQFTAPCGIAAIYAHPIEHLFSNVIPVAMGPLVMRSHPMTAMIWGILALFNTMTVHSGYDLTKWMIFPAPYFHDWHHEKFNENFGATQLLDILFDTNKNYLLTIEKNEMYVPRKVKK